MRTRRAGTPRPTPQQARTDDAICRLARDHVLGDDWSATLEPDAITIAVGGHSVRMPRRDFDALVRWYTTGRWRAPR